MYKVGITGGIGTGKSIICAVFSVFGIPIYDADTRAKWLTENDPLIKKALTTNFGSEVFQGNTLNRTYLAAVAFADEAKTQQLNAIIHPVVASDFSEWIRKQMDAPYVVKEAALFFETGNAKEMDTMIVVSTPMALRMERVLKRDKHRTEKQLQDIISRQLPEDKKIALADHVLYNDEHHLLVPQVLALHEQFIRQALL